MWVIWKTRNDVIFNKGKIQLEKMLQDVAYWYTLNSCELNTSTLLTEQDKLNYVDCVWVPPSPLKRKINFDGAAGSKGYACAAVSRKSQSEVDGCLTRVLDISSPVEAQTQGALLNVELAISMGLHHIIVEGDSMRYRHSPTPWRIKNIISRVKEKLSLFTS